MRKLLRKLPAKWRKKLVLALGGYWDWWGIDNTIDIESREAQKLFETTFKKERATYTVAEHRDRMTKFHKAIQFRGTE